MDHAAALREARRALRARTAAGEIDAAASAFLHRRIDGLKGRADRLALGFARHAAAARHVNATLAAVRTARDGGRIVAIDAGWRAEGVLEEVGIATWEDGRIRTRTWRASTWRKRERALYGKVTVVDRGALPGIVRRAYAEADLAAFHDAAGDLAKTGVDTSSCPYADTALLDAVVSDAMPRSLEALHARYVGGSCAHAHESGNDAHRTLLVLLAMADLPPMATTGFARPGSARSGHFREGAVARRVFWDKIERETTRAEAAFRAIPFLRTATQPTG